MLTSALALAGCGVHVTAGGEREGEVRGVVTSEEGASPSRAPNGGVTYSLARSDDAVEAQGTVTYNATMALVTESGAEVRLTNGPVPGTFRIEGADSSEAGRRRVEARTYTRARITFHQVEANVSGGVTLPGGIALTGTVRVDLGAGGSVVVDAPIQLTVQEGGSHLLVVDLNAHTWLASANPVTRVVSATTFRSAVEVRAR